ncbi:thioesterase II family protein [Actinomadura kijaniata]|uniref:thioesterase II family protein n=1 Tax=Actinomadura kijaniata TaxID=46161 RepID=UPI003F197FAE
MTATRSRWLLRRPGQDKAAPRLYCFPHSGGSAGEYMRWSARLPSAEVWGVQPPGRGGRLAEPAPTTMEALVEALTAEADFGPAPYAFFGHSLGALAAYETALALRAQGRPGPRALFLSAYGAPHLHRPGPPVHTLDGPGLIAAVEAEHGPLPAELHSDPELAGLVLGGLRADLSIVASYRPAPAAPLDCAVTVYGGSRDREDAVRLSAWEDYTTGPFTLRVFAGDHFYFRENPDDLLTHLDRALAERV